MAGKPLDAGNHMRNNDRNVLDLLNKKGLCSHSPHFSFAPVRLHCHRGSKATASAHSSPVAMGRGTLLDEYERGQILAFETAGWNANAIAKEIGRSHHVVATFLANKEGYGTRKSTGRPPKLTAVATRRLFREATKGQSSCSQLVADLDLPVGHRRVQQLLRNNPEFVYMKRKSTPRLSEKHKKARLVFARAHVVSARDWSQVIFSDEKKFNLDGPDGWQYYWHHLQHEEQLFSRRQNGGGSVMVWGAFSAKGRSELCILEGNQNSYAYTVTLSDYLLPFAHADHGNEYIFQQDNASIHSSRETKEWLDEQEIVCLPWPARSPDLNPIENAWAVLARAVYANGRQFADRQSLITAILRCWGEISTDYMTNLINSMPNRCADVLVLQGKKTSH
jgi:transposase